MKTLALTLFASIIASQTPAQADPLPPSPTHVFSCATQQGAASKQILITIRESALADGIANYEVSKRSNGQWVKIAEATNALVKLTWGRSARNKPAITSAFLDLGRSGQIEMHTTEAYDERNSAKGLVRAKTLRISLPKDTEAQCSYSLRLRRPAVIGSN